MPILYSFAAFTLLWLGVPLVHRALQTWILDARCRKDGVIALTFDDGPSGNLTPDILELLKAASIHATFFVLGRNTRRHPEVTRRILEEGHDLGCHGDEHLDAWWVSPRRSLGDLKRGVASVPSLPGQSMIFRPARGRMTLLTWGWMISRSARIAWWTVDSGDTRGMPAESHAIVDRVVRRGGGIVLLHDFDGSEEHRRFVLEVTQGLLVAASTQGLEIRPLSELLGVPTG